MADINLENIYQAKSETLLEHYNCLTSAIAKYYYPWKLKLFPGLPNPENWTISRKKLFRAFMPYAITEPAFRDGERVKDIRLFLNTIILWLLIFALWFFLSSLMLRVSFDWSLPDNPLLNFTQQGLNFLLYFCGIIYILFGSISLVIYGQLFWYLLNPKISGSAKFLWVIVFLLIICLDYIKISRGKFTPLEALHLPAPANIIFSSTALVFWVPHIILLAFLVLFYCRMLLLGARALVIYLDKTLSALPNYSGYINQLIAEPFGKIPNTWKIVDLPINEISSLKELAKNELDITEKKTVPIVIILAIMAILITIEPIREYLISGLTGLLDFIQAPFQQQDVTLQDIIIRSFEFVLKTFFILIPAPIIGQVAQLLNNIFIQGTLLEACTIAEYAKLEFEKEMAKQNQPRSPWQIFFDGLFSFLKR